MIDQKNDTGASEVFRKVLVLDPENVLALKILAEIAERGGRFDETAEWLGRLLSADPMNGGAAEAPTPGKGRAGPAGEKAPQPGGGPRAHRAPPLPPPPPPPAAALPPPRGL